MDEVDPSVQRSPDELARNHLVVGLTREGELTADQAHKVLEVIAHPGPLARWEMELNVYIVTLDFEAAVARLDDDLDPSPDGTLLMYVPETRALLESYLHDLERLTRRR